MGTKTPALRVPHLARGKDMHNAAGRPRVIRPSHLVEVMCARSPQPERIRSLAGNRARVIEEAVQRSLSEPRCVHAG